MTQVIKLITLFFCLIVKHFGFLYGKVLKKFPYYYYYERTDQEGV